MSAEATGWVYRHSPYRGVPFAVHLAIADSVNDQNADEFWMRQHVLAGKARTTRGSVNAAIATMIDDGLLELVRVGTGGANRYRFVMPEGSALVYDPRSKVSREPTPSPAGVRAQTTPGARSDDTEVSAQTTPGARSPRTEPKGNPTEEPKANEPPPLTLVTETPVAVVPTFDEFWQTWPKPRRVGKGEASKAWTRATKRAAPETIIEGALRYADETADREPRFVAHPSTWLNRDGWDDEPGAHRGAPAARRTRDVSIRRDVETGRVAAEDL